MQMQLLCIVCDDQRKKKHTDSIERKSTKENIKTLTFVYWNLKTNVAAQPNDNRLSTVNADERRHSSREKNKFILWAFLLFPKWQKLWIPWKIFFFLFVLFGIAGKKCEKNKWTKLWIQKIACNWWMLAALKTTGVNKIQPQNVIPFDWETKLFIRWKWSFEKIWVIRFDFDASICH